MPVDIAHDMVLRSGYTSHSDEPDLPINRIISVNPEDLLLTTGNYSVIL